MNQGFAAPVIQQPETSKKRKKNFCFATIPLIFIALFSLYESIINSLDIPSNWYELLNDSDYLYTVTGDFMYLFSFVFVFIGAAVLTILLFTKVYNAWLGVPLFTFSAGNLFICVSEVAYAYGLTCGEEIIFDSFAEALWDSLPFILIYFSVSVAFFIVAVYTFIVTLRKKPAPKVLWIIPAILFCILYAPFTILLSGRIIEMAFIDILWALKYVPYFLVYLTFPIAIILFLIWLSFPYKKDKSKKITQPSPVMPPVHPVIENKPEVNAVVEPEIKPAVQPANNSDIEQLRNSTQLLKEYKTLLDDGLISQEDYDKKKNELLDL